MSLSLNRTDEFKYEDILDDINSYGIEVENMEKVVKNTILKLNENGIIEQLGSYYCVMNNGDSRWLHFGK